MRGGRGNRAGSGVNGVNGFISLKAHYLETKARMRSGFNNYLNAAFIEFSFILCLRM